MKNILFVGHDIKFIDIFIDYLKNYKDKYNIKIDKWKGHNQHDIIESKKLLNWAHIIFCEWGLGNLVWYSQNKKNNQKLIARLHCQERFTEYYKKYNTKNIDKFICVSPYFMDIFIEKIKLPKNKCILIPNALDCQRFNLSKLQNIEYNIGIVGIIPKRKRLDLAVNLIEKLNTSIEKTNNRKYKLYILGKKPYEYEWLMKREDEKKYYDDIFLRIKNNEHIIFDEYTNQPEKWYQKINYIISVSDFESFHYSIAEGMASGCIPLILNWNGSEYFYPKEYIFKNLDEIVKFIKEKKNINRNELKQYIKKYDKSFICTKLENYL